MDKLIVVNFNWDDELDYEYHLAIEIEGSGKWVNDAFRFLFAWAWELGVLVSFSTIRR